MGITDVHLTPKWPKLPQKIFCDPCKIFVNRKPPHSRPLASLCSLLLNLRQ